MCNFFNDPVYIGEECPFCGEQRPLKPIRINDVVWDVCKLCEIEMFFSEEDDE